MHVANRSTEELAKHCEFRTDDRKVGDSPLVSGSRHRFKIIYLLLYRQFIFAIQDVAG